MPEKWHCFFVKPSHIHKYSMKYDFSTYILNKLNEADEKKKKDNITINPEGSKKVVISSDTTEKELANFIKKHIDDIEIKDEGDKKVYVFNGEQGEYTFENKPNLPFDKLYKKALEDSKDGDNKLKSLDKDGFELLGKTIAYRSALTVWNIVNNSGDDFKQATLDVFKDNSEYSIKQLENLDSLLDYSAAVGVVKDKKNRLDKNDANYETLLKKCNDAEAKLTTKENYTTIQQIKKDYEKEFKDKRDVYEKAFNDGMAEQKKDMQAKDYKWKDPATGQPPKGKLAKSNQAADAIFKSIQSGVDKAGEFAKRQQGLDKAILSLAVMGVKGMMFGGKMLKKLLTGFLTKSNLKDMLRYTAKFNTVKDKINVFKKEYDEWKKYNDAQQQKKEKTDDEKKEEEDRKKTISAKLTELMNTHVIPYYYCKMAIIIACFENLEGKYIIKQENNKWSTYNSGSGRLTIIEDNAILMERILEVVNNQLVKGGVFETLKDESSADAFKGIPKAFKYHKQYADNLLKWKDKIKSVSTVSKFNKDNLKNILNVYNEKVIVNHFDSYAAFAEYVPIAQGLVKQHDIPVAKEIVIKFDGDEDAGIPGIVTGAKKEDNQEEEKPPVTEEVAKEALNNVTYKDGNVYIKYSEYNGTKDFNVSFNKENAEKKEHLEGFTDVYSKYKDVFDEWVNQNKDNKDLQEPINIMKIALGDNNEDKEEQKDVFDGNSQELKDKYKTITDELVALKELNDMTKVTETIDKVNGEITKFENDIKTILDKMDKDEKVKKNEIIQKYHKIIFATGENSLKQILFAKTLMSIFDLKECVYLNNIVKLMNEAEIPNVENRVNNTKKAINSFIEKKLTNNDSIADLAKYCDKITNEIKEIYDTLTKEDNDDKLKNKLKPYSEDPLKLLYAMSMLDQLKTPENTESEENKEENKEPEGEKVAKTAEKEKEMANA